MNVDAGDGANRQGREAALSLGVVCYLWAPPRR